MGEVRLERETQRDIAFSLIRAVELPSGAVTVVDEDEFLGDKNSDQYRRWIAEKSQEEERDRVRGIAQAGRGTSYAPGSGVRGEVSHFTKCGCFLVGLLFLVMVADWQNFGLWLWNRPTFFGVATVVLFLAGGAMQKTLYPIVRFVNVWAYRLIAIGVIALLAYMFIRSQ